MRIIIFTVPDQPLKEREIIIINIKINGSDFTQRGRESIVDDLFMGTELVEKQEDL